MLRDASAPERTRDQLIAAVVAGAPPLTGERRARLAVLLTTAPVQPTRRPVVMAA